jgi:hypothetical protein
MVMSDEIDMEMDGALIHLMAGDILVQRGTIHKWINNSTARCAASRTAPRSDVFLITSGVLA